MTSKTEIFKQLLNSPNLSFALEAHNGISAKIVENSGFQSIWASGLSISTSLGLRDCNEITWTSLVNIVEHMADVTSIPIVVDGDNGHGNFNNVRLFTKKLCQIGAAAVCIEDKVFPKTNSFVESRNQSLVSIDEFCGKIKAAKDSMTNDSFSVIARVEALIVGAGMPEAIKRADAYFRSGADAILIHSKRADPSEIIEFTKQWHNLCPVIIVPTKYYTTPAEVYRKANISLVIWANHNMRASVKAMEDISRKIFRDQSIIDVESKITNLNEIFETLNYQEIEVATKKYSGLIN